MVWIASDLLVNAVIGQGVRHCMHYSIKEQELLQEAVEETVQQTELNHTVDLRPISRIEGCLHLLNGENE